MINKRIATAIATGALLLNSFAVPAFAATDVTVTGNGRDSDNTASVNLSKSNTVVQNNTAKVSNNVDVSAKTGGNKANDNSGGDVSIDTGNSSVGVAVKNMLNKNSASVDCCENGDTTVKIGDNLRGSDNNVDLNMDKTNSVFQDNSAHVNNDVDVDSKTGGNQASDNSSGDVSIDTGKSDVTVGILTFANANFAKIGGGSNAGGDLSLWVSGNGRNSDNSIDANIDASNTVTQDNNAHVGNDVNVDGNTGSNKAGDNNGGEVSVDTGNSSVDALVANVGNFNWADMSCGCLFDDVTAKVANNGRDSDNSVNLDLSDNQKAFQDNGAHVYNDLDVNGDTGYNKAEDNNSGSNGADPSIDTGRSDVGTEVVNQFNSNNAGIGSEFDFDFDWDAMLGSILG